MTKTASSHELNSVMQFCTNRIEQLISELPSNNELTILVNSNYSGSRIGNTETWNNVESIGVVINGKDEDAWQIEETGNSRQVTHYAYHGNMSKVHLVTTHYSRWVRLLSFTRVDRENPHRIDINNRLYDTATQDVGEFPYLPSGLLLPSTKESRVNGRVCSTDEFMKLFVKVSNSVERLMKSGDVAKELGHLVIPKYQIRSDGIRTRPRSLGPFTSD